MIKQLTAVELNILTDLNKEPITNISKYIFSKNLSFAWVYTIIDRLKEKGFITKIRKGRTISIKLSPKGKTYLKTNYGF